MSGTGYTPAQDITRGTVLDNVTRRLVVEHAESDGTLSRITYRYTDDRGLLRGQTATVPCTERLRVRTDVPSEQAERVLAATLGLPL